MLPGYRLHGLRLLKAVLRQEGYHFTDLSPSGNVVGINEKLSFRFLDTTTALVPNLPGRRLPGRGRISSDPDADRAHRSPAPISSSTGITPPPAPHATWS